MYPMPFATAKYWNNCTLIFPFHKSILFALVLKMKKMEYNYSTEYFSIYKTKSTVYECSLVRFIEHNHNADFFKRLSTNHTDLNLLRFYFSTQIQKSVNWDLKSSLFLPNSDYNGKYNLFNCSSEIFKIAPKRNGKKQTNLRYDHHTVSSEISQILLPMHSVVYWPLLVAFVKQTPKQILETKNVCHTENHERDLTDYFNFVSPTDILQALLITRKFNPATAILQPCTDREQWCLPATVRFLLHF